MLVNAAGPWAAKVASLALGAMQPAIRLVRGSHLIVRRRLAHGAAYTLQNADGRIMFAIPYGDDFTLLGTTDQDHPDDPSNPAMTDAERDYILASANAYLREKLTADDIVHAYAGVRALYNDGASAAKDATREYVLALDDCRGPHPLGLWRQDHDLPEAGRSGDGEDQAVSSRARHARLDREGSAAGRDTSPWRDATNSCNRSSRATRRWSRRC